MGWDNFFQQQLSLEEWGASNPARVIGQHKSVFEVEAGEGKLNITVTKSTPQLTVGDWVLLDTDNGILRVLQRKSCFRRKAAGSKQSEQLIAANVDTAFIVCSLNDDFNLNRIERYLSIVHEAGSEPVVVLSKADICLRPESFQHQVQALDCLLNVEMVNCLESSSVSVLLPWCQQGQTVVMLGSSGSGKSTLSNTLMGEEVQATREIREGDAKGRHTTTRRSLLSMPCGAMLLDTPGMREVQLTGCEEGVYATFADIENLSEHCRFDDCRHGAEPGCAVQHALEVGELDKRRFTNYCKLIREQALNEGSLVDRRAKDREMGMLYKRVQQETKKIKRG
ncbi:MAG: putative ribosome biogenesis GTPase RsgA 2 [marine bacterium B5-7]|nr:MAG: putative ribosome biogenesis GTPase RsgA 2 [marine bacterium B5-7]